MPEQHWVMAVYQKQQIGQLSAYVKQLPELRHVPLAGVTHHPLLARYISVSVARLWFAYRHIIPTDGT